MPDLDVWSLNSSPKCTQSTADLVVTHHAIPDIDAQYRNAPSEKPWIAPALQEVLFSRGSRTFFIVDATLRTNITGSFDLEEIQQPVRSFFIGGAAKKFRTVAPYLIDMTLPLEAWENPALVPDFHLDFFKNHWKHGTGIFVRTPATMDDVWSNFRKFTKVKLSNGKVSYFRFWDPAMLMYFLRASTHAELERFFITSNDVFCTGRSSELFDEVQVYSAHLNLGR